MIPSPSPCLSFGHLKEKATFQGGAFSFSRLPHPPLKTATANNLCIYLLCQMERDGLRGGSSWAVGRGCIRGAICLVVSSIPSREVVAPLSHLASRAVYSPGEAECPPASGRGLCYTESGDAPLSPCVCFHFSGVNRRFTALDSLRNLPWPDTFQGSWARKAVSILRVGA